MESKTYPNETSSLVKINFVYLLTGIFVIVLLNSTQTIFYEYPSFFPDFNAVRTTCLISGVSIIVIGIFGFYAIYSAIPLAKTLLVTAMGLAFVFQLGTSIACFVFRGQTAALVLTQMQTTMEYYGSDMNYLFTRDWDRVQEDFSCCGVNTAGDWFEYLNTELTGEMPISCCSRYYGAVAVFRCTIREANRIGCAKAVGSWAASQMAVMGIVGTLLALVQAFMLTIIAFRRAHQPKNVDIPEDIKKQVI